MEPRSDSIDPASISRTSKKGSLVTKKLTNFLFFIANLSGNFKLNWHPVQRSERDLLFKYMTSLKTWDILLLVAVFLCCLCYLFLFYLWYIQSILPDAGKWESFDKHFYQALGNTFHLLIIWWLIVGYFFKYQALFNVKG